MLLRTAKKTDTRPDEHLSIRLILGLVRLSYFVLQLPPPILVCFMQATFQHPRRVHFRVCNFADFALHPGILHAMAVYTHGVINSTKN